MDYSQTLQWLQSLLGKNQTTQGQQWNQGLGLQQSALSEKGREYDAGLALQKVIADWQNQMANKQFGLQQQQAQEAIAQQRLQNDPGYQLAMQNSLGKIDNTKGIEELARYGFLPDLNPLSKVYFTPAGKLNY